MHTVLAVPPRRAALFHVVLVGAAVAFSLSPASARAADEALTVFTESNAPGGNELLVFVQRDDGSLALRHSVSAHGLGSGGGLSNQGAVALSPGASLIFAVNAASNTIASFRRAGEEIEFVAATPSGGQTPVSLTVRGNRLYVLNQGSDAIAGFRFRGDGSLEALPGSTQGLSGAGVVGAQVSFSSGGDFLIATEKVGNQIGVFEVIDGVAQPGHFEPSFGAVPFGFAVDRRDRLVVSEAGGSAVTSYDLDTDTGRLSVISGSVPTNQVAACWVAETPDGRFAFTGNTGSGSVSAFSVDHAGRLGGLGSTVISPTASTTDLATSADNRLLFALDDGVRTINGFRIGADGSLQPLSVMAPLNLLRAATGLAIHRTID